MPTDPDLPRRLRWMTALAVAAFAALGARAVHLQAVQGTEHAARLDAARVQRIPLPAPRGTVRDARGRVVAEDRILPDGRRGRSYPFGPIGAHAIGYRNEVTPAEVTPDGPYRAGDRIGRAGVERAFEKTLRGSPGHAFRPASRRVSVPAGYEDVPPVRGNDVTLTLDMELCEAVEHAFQIRGATPGAAVVLDVHTGDLRALVSRPSFDPNLVDQGVAVAAQEGASEIDRALMEPEIPGAVLKPFTALAVLRGGAPGAHGRVDLRDALSEGYAGWFFHHAAQRVGLDAIAAEARSFGLGVPTGIALGQEAEGLVPTRAWYDRYEPGTFTEAHTRSVAVGRGDVRVTPLQLAVAYATLANGGTVLKPRIVAVGEPTVRRKLDVSQAHLAEVRAALRPGWAEEWASGVFTHGQTHDPRARDDSWFAGYFPADAPEVAIVMHTKGAELPYVDGLAADVIWALKKGAGR